MSTKNRGDRIQLLQKVVSKHYTPVLAAEDRSVLEHLLYACCLEDAPHEAADEAFHRLQESFFDWNEVRVTTVSELCETLHNLPEPSAAALRIKKNLQSLFETRYSFEIDDMIKMNQGKAVQELEKLGGMTKFVLGYVTQNALGGHAIPVSHSMMQVLLATEIVSPTEAEKGQAPGLERTIPKTKGPAFTSCLHQLALDYMLAPGGKQTKAIMKEAGASEPKKLPPEKEKPAGKEKPTGKEKKGPSPSPVSAAGSTGNSAASPKKAGDDAKSSDKGTKTKSSGKLPESSTKAKPSPKAADTSRAAASAPLKKTTPKLTKPSAPKKPTTKKTAGKKTASKGGSISKNTKRKPR